MDKVKKFEDNPERYLGSLDVINPLDFKEKNHFFYQNAGAILDPVNHNNKFLYLDILGKITQPKKKIVIKSPPRNERISISREAMKDLSGQDIFYHFSKSPTKLSRGVLNTAEGRNSDSISPDTSMVISPLPKNAHIKNKFIISNNFFPKKNQSLELSSIRPFGEETIKSPIYNKNCGNSNSKQANNSKECNKHKTFFNSTISSIGQYSDNFSRKSSNHLVLRHRDNNSIHKITGFSETPNSKHNQTGFKMAKNLKKDQMQSVSNFKTLYHAKLESLDDNSKKFIFDVPFKKPGTKGESFRTKLLHMNRSISNIKEEDFSKYFYEKYPQFTNNNNYKTIGKAKILSVPKKFRSEYKRDQVRNPSIEVENIMKSTLNKKENIETSLFFDKLSENQNNFKGNQLFISVKKSIDFVEKENLILKNKIIDIKKEYQESSYYVDPKNLVVINNKF